MNAGFLIAVLFAVVTSAFGATDVDKFELVGKDNNTPVSGYAGRWTELGTQGDYQALNYIAWGEKTDDPCGLFISTRHINTHTRALDTISHAYAFGTRDEIDQALSDAKKYVFGKFEGSQLFYGPGHKFKLYDFIALDCGGNRKEVSAIANDKFLYKLNACTTDKRKSSDGKLKGIRIWVRTLTYKDYKEGRAPELIDEPTPQEAYHTNCAKWHTPVACDPGEVAARLRVHHNDVGHRDWVTGLSLICKKVALKQPPPKKPMPVHDEVQRPAR
jgi:hypothetical protein